MFCDFADFAAHFRRKNNDPSHSSRHVLTPVARFSFVLTLAIALLGATSSSANAQTRYSINPAKSQVQFSLGGFHDVNGFFKVGSGDITFNPKSGAMTGSIVVEAGSGNSGDNARDKKMKGDELHAGKFPSITFAPTQYTGTLNPSGQSNIQVHGVFTLIGKPHTIIVPMTVTINGTQCTAKGSFTVPYVNWGMKDPTMMFMKEAKDVTIDLNFQGTLAQ
jgi:polyisoprenoid-binding protein YceI